VRNIISEREGDILTLTLNRTSRRNALNSSLLNELNDEVEKASTDATLRAVVITGDASAFSAGQDLKEEEPHNFIALINRVFGELERLRLPTVAAIDGWCLAGGLELALCCDFRVCATTAKIGDWHARIGSIGGAGATVRLVRTIGPTKAKELVFTGAALDGQAALMVGLVSYVYPPEDLLGNARAFARTLCTGSLTTVAFAKRSLNAAIDLSLAEALDYSLLCQHAVRGAPA
jgi:enoyl-CoA hydratase